jgi:pilus assembly protein CpaF
MIEPAPDTARHSAGDRVLDRAADRRPLGGAAAYGLAGAVRRRLVAERAAPTPAALAGAVVDAGVLGGSAVLGATASVADELVGLGPLTTVVADPLVTDVVVNGAHEVWCDRGDGLEPTQARFPDDAAVRRFAERLAAYAGRRLDDAQPFVDVGLPGGVRLHAVLPPVAAPGPLLSVRIPRREAWSLADLVDAGGLAEPLADLLGAVVSARLAFLVTGGTGTGKTTLLSALLGCVDPRERVVLVEEIPELRPALPHVVRLQARGANAEGSGAVSLSDLVRETLRMRPDRVVVGEARGAEVVVLLRALNSGHEGGCGTVHANGIADVPARIEALATAAGVERRAAHSLLGSAVDVVVHARRDRVGRRWVAAVGVLTRDSDGLVRPVVAVQVPAAGLAPVPADGVGALRALLSERGEPCPL